MAELVAASEAQGKAARPSPLPPAAEVPGPEVTVVGGPRDVRLRPRPEVRTMMLLTSEG